jgi:hypothetical protein
MNNEMMPKENEKLNPDNDWDILSSDLSDEEYHARIKQRIANYESTLSPEDEEKMLDEKYRDFLSELAERNKTSSDVIDEGMDTLIKYGNDSVRMTLHTNARVGENGPISGYFSVSPEDAAKTWFQEMINEVGGDVRVDESQSTNFNK